MSPTLSIAAEFSHWPLKRISDILHCRYRWLWLLLLLLLFISGFPLPPIGTCVGCRLFLLHWPNDIKSKKVSIRYLKHVDNHTIAWSFFAHSFSLYEHTKPIVSYVSAKKGHRSSLGKHNHKPWYPPDRTPCPAQWIWWVCWIRSQDWHHWGSTFLRFNHRGKGDRHLLPRAAVSIT